MLRFFCLFIVLPYVASIDVVVVGGIQAVCAGETVSVQCRVSGDKITWNTPDGALNLLRGWLDEGIAGSYNWTLEELDNNYLQSTLTFNVSSQVIIRCRDRSNSSQTANISVEGLAGATNKPLTGLDRIKRKNSTFSTVSVVWMIPNTNAAHISSYVVTVNPAIVLLANGVIAANETREISLDLKHGQQYNISVRADSCNNTRQGGTSIPLTVNIQVPSSTEKCTALPVYDYFSNSLIMIDIQWDPIPEIAQNITDGITASVQSYLISAIPISLSAPLINVTIGASDESICTTVCRYKLQNTTEMSALHYSVSVTAKNMLTDGYGDGTICNTETISARNDILAIEMRQSCNGSVEILCRLLSRFEGSAKCKVMYMIFPYTEVYSDTSEIYGGAEDIVSIVLSQSFEPNTVLFIEAHTVGGQQDAAVLGRIKLAAIGCGDPKQQLQSHVHVSSQNRSMVTFSCDPGYSLHGISTSQCVSGEWTPSPETVTCQNLVIQTPSLKESSNNNADILLDKFEVLIIAAVIGGLCSFAAGLILGCLLTQCKIICCHTQQKEGQTERHPVYEDILPAKGTGIELQHNEAYGQT